MLKKFFAFSALIAVLNFTVAIFTATNFNVAYAETDTKGKSDSVSASVVDTQNLLTPDEINSLTQKINAVEQKYSIKIGIEILNNTHGKNLEKTANSLLDKNFSGAPNGGILLLIVMDTRNWRISTDSKMMKLIPNADALASHSFLQELSEGKYYNACKRYVDGVEYGLNYYANTGEPYYVDDSYTFEPLLLITGFLLAIIIAGFFRHHLISSMSNVHMASEAGEYLQRNSIKITEEKDRFLFTNVTRRPKSKGRSGGGGSHGGSGGSF